MPQKMQLEYTISVENFQWLRKAAFKTADELPTYIRIRGPSPKMDLGVLRNQALTLGHINKALICTSIKSMCQHVPMSRVTHLGCFQACTSWESFWHLDMKVLLTAGCCLCSYLALPNVLTAWMSLLLSPLELKVISDWESKPALCLCFLW